MKGEIVNRADTFVSKGTTILKAVPFAYCLKSSFRELNCDFCLKPNSGIRRCTGCLTVSYCDRGCQRLGWSNHKGECKNMKRVKPNVPTDSVRLISRIIFKLQKGGDTESEIISGTNKSRKFKDLMSHYKEVKEDSKRMEHFVTICTVLNEYLTDVVLPNPAELLGIYGRVCVNSFNIVNGEMQSVGTGIYLAPSILDHSCSPNAVVTFDGFHLRVQLLEDLPVLDWDSIRISYIDLMNCNSDRKKELKERYYFDCDCPRCNSDDIDRYHYAAKCPRCGSPVPVKKGESIAPCECGNLIDKGRAQRFWEATEYSEQQLILMQEINYLDVCKICLTKQSDLLHDFCLARCKMLDAAFDSAILLELWDSALEFGVPLIPAYKLWYGSQHPLTAILLLKLFKILMLTSTSRNADPAALAYYNEALSIIELTHGKSSSFYYHEVKPLIQQIK